MNIFLVVSALLVGGCVGVIARGSRGRSTVEPVAPTTLKQEAPRGIDLLELLPIPLAVYDEVERRVRKNRSLSTLVSGSTAVLLDDVVDNAMRKAIEGEQVVETHTFNGPPMLVCEVRAGSLDGSGAYVVVSDITDKTRTESMRTDFVANISHELKTPVGAVAVLAEALLGETDPAVIDRLTQRMLAESERAARTIDDLLELSRAEEGKIDSKVSLKIDALLNAVQERYEEAARQRDIEIVIESSNVCAVLGNREQLASALGNLVDNAVKYSLDGGQVTLRSRAESESVVLGSREQLASALGNLVDNAVKYSLDGGQVTLRSRAESESVVIEVCDSGVGIPQRDLDRIFERFYRVDKARSRGTGGTGLGLAIVRHVVTNHGGRVEVSSVEGEGSCFRLRFPLEHIR